MKPAEAARVASVPVGDAARRRSAAWITAMPWLFVAIWSTGFIVARFAMPHSPPLKFLSLRYALSAGCFGIWIAFARPRWPQGRSQYWHLIVVGVLIQAGYLGGVWSAVKAGIGAGTVALLVGLQPVLTALLTSRVASRDASASDRADGNERGDGGDRPHGGERVDGNDRAHGSGPAHGATGGVSPRQWCGLACGLAGLVLVVWRKLGVGEISASNLAMALLALLAITAGTLYQKRFVAAGDVRTASLLQLLAALAVSLPPALLFEAEPLIWHPQLLGALAWSVLVLTLGGSSLFYLLIQRGAATEVTSLMYLVPPCTALLAWAIFDEAFTSAMVIGLLLTAAGVALVLRNPRR